MDDDVDICSGGNDDGSGCVCPSASDDDVDADKSICVVRCNVVAKSRKSFTSSSTAVAVSRAKS
jgi:hypothetical protein